LSCGVQVAFGQAYKSLPIPPEAEQDVNTMLEGYKNNPDDMTNLLKPLLKKYKKKTENLVALGYLCFQKEQYSPAITLSQEAYERDPEMLSAAHLEGDCYFQLERYGEAAQKYVEAQTLAPDDKYAYFQEVEVYKFINAGYSLEKMDVIKKKYPDDPAIDKIMASIYYHLNDTAKAGATYKSYFAKVKYPDDLKASEEYAIVRFLNKDYAGSLEVVNAIIDKNPNAISLNRMKFYDLIELKKYEEAAPAADKFFGAYVDTLYNFMDYKYMGALQLQLKNNEKASKALIKAAEMAPADKPEIFKELSKNLQKVGEYDKAVEAYQKYIEKAKPGSVPEMLNKGKIYYSAATDTAITDSLVKDRYIQAGSKIFLEVADQAKDSYLGPFWSARINSTTDPNGAVEAAMTQYGETFKRLEGKSEDYDGIRVECLRYMTFYYLKIDDYEKCGEYADKVLAIDENDSLAKQIKGVLAQLTKKK